MSKFHLDIEAIYTRLKIIDNFLKDKNTISDLFYEKVDSAGRLSIAWPELLMLRGNLNRLGFILISLPLELRRIIIMFEEILGISKRRFMDEFGISTEMMGKFSGYYQLKGSRDCSLIEYKNRMNHKNTTFLTEKYPLILFASVSLLSRIPCKWIMHDTVKRDWDTLQFELLDPSPMTREEFLNTLYQLDFNSHDVKAIILYSVDLNAQIKLRIENQYGLVIIEAYDLELNARYLYEIEKLLGYNCISSGYMKTVVHERVNPTFLWKHPLSNNILKYPVEFIS
ncbi:hypothetical protein LJR153_002008 [Paenibacillus sp. LjRoot153]|uniref:hypothetical protein n=1 Tax=Paenibacillus sp. LjRoot153 TaxID=3342270 RepID=UPI003ECC7BFD